MTGKERVSAALHYRRPDRVPLQYYYSPVGYYEHGEKLNDLYASLPGDFGPFRRIPVPAPSDTDFDGNGRYHAFRRDEWGTLWEYRIFGIAGIPAEYPPSDLSHPERWKFPPDAALSGPDFEEECAKVRQNPEYYCALPAGSLFERLIALLPEEDVLCGIELEEPGIGELADRITARNRSFAEQAAAAGADGIRFGDDYGTERGMIMSPATWRRFFKPRLSEIFAPARRAGLDILFHSCGQIAPILEDLREIGVTSIWPQLPAYDMQELADRCRSLGLAVAVHTDRAGVMTHGTPRQVRELVLREYETFRMRDGGSWFYVEADNGFPFENLEALVHTIGELRSL